MGITVLNPRGTRESTRRTPLSARLASLNGKTIYCVAQDRPRFTEEISKRLAAALPASNIVYRKKPGWIVDTDADLWNEIQQNADALVYGTGMGGGSGMSAVTWLSEIEKKGIPSAYVAGALYERDIRMSALMRGLPSLRAVFVKLVGEENIGEADGTDYDLIVSRLIESLTMPLSEEERRCDDIVTEAQPHIAMTGTYDEVQDYFAAGGLSDGLPIVPPTEEKVAEMLSGTRRARDEVVTTRMFPEELTVTVEKVAIVGAMAGCQPGHMPVLLSLVNNWGSNPLFGQAVRSDSTFNLMIVVNGPIRREIDMNQGSNAMGPGNRANASIGRFLRLAIICLGGSIPGANDLSAQGNPVKYGFCFPENEEESPWEPFHVSQGFGANESVVSLWAGGWCFWSLCADLDLLARAFGSFPQTGGALLMSLEAARLYNGLKMSKADVEQYVLEHAHQQLFDQQPTWYKVDMPPINRLSPSASPTAIPSDGLSIKIIVVGGETSIPIAQAWHFNPATSTPVDNWR